MATLLTLDGVSLSHGKIPLFEDVCLSINPKARMCLLGRNGCGKSTLMKIMAGLIQPDHGERITAPSARVAYLAQDPDFTGFARLYDFVTEGLPIEEHYRAEIAAEGLRIDMDLSCVGASGGERRRAAICQLLAADPDVMLLDEPTNHLDIAAIEWLAAHLSQSNAAFVIISHDRRFLADLTRETLWLDRGVMRYAPRGFKDFEAWRDQVFAEEDQARHKLKRLIKAEAKWAVEGISARRKRNQGRMRRLHELRQEHKAQIRRQGAAALALDDGEASGHRVIEAWNISKSYGDREILRPFSIRITRGERIGFIGPNGAGKTTLLSLLSGALPPDSGTVRIGKAVTSALFDQNRDAIDPSMTLWDSLTNDEELGVSGQNDQIMVRGVPRHVVGYLRDFLFSEEQIRGPVSVLSGGEKARLLLARIMARPSNLLILDEPTNDLDIETLDLLEDVLADYAGTVLIVSHDRDFLDRIATRSVVMEGDGEAVIYAGGWSDYQAQRGQHAVGRKTKTTLEKPAKRVKPSKSTGADASGAASKAASSGLSFTEKHRLEALPGEIAKLEAEIAKLQEYLADPMLYTDAPLKFDKASEALIAREALLAAAEAEWLELAERAEA